MRVLRYKYWVLVSLLSMSCLLTPGIDDALRCEEGAFSPRCVGDAAEFCQGGILFQTDCAALGERCDVEAATCVALSCGDGVVSAEEECDDGNGIDTDACRNTCEAAFCGDGVVENGVEDCDPPGVASCDEACQLACQNDVDCLDGDACTDNERCEGGNCRQDAVSVDDDSVCTIDRCDPIGGISHESISVDDSNDCTIDGCDPVFGVLHSELPDGTECLILPNFAGNCIGGSCVPRECGDGILNLFAESCDDGNTESGDGCRGDCLGGETCGDTLVDVNEQCDDGNTSDFDGCSANCLFE